MSSYHERKTRPRAFYYILLSLACNGGPGTCVARVSAMPAPSPQIGIQTTAIGCLHEDVH